MAPGMGVGLSRGHESYGHGLSTGRRRKAVGKVTIWWPSDAPVQGPEALALERFAQSAVEAGICLFCSWRRRAARSAAAQGREPGLPPPPWAGAYRSAHFGGMCVEHGLALSEFATTQVRARVGLAAFRRLSQTPRLVFPERRRTDAPICALCQSESSGVRDRMPGAVRWLETAAAEALLREHPGLVCVPHADCVRSRWSRRGGARLYCAQSTALFDWADGRDLPADPLPVASFLLGAAVVLPTWKAAATSASDTDDVTTWVAALLGGDLCPSCRIEGQVLNRFADTLSTSGQGRGPVATQRLGDVCRLHALALVAKAPGAGANGLLAAIAGRVLAVRSCKGACCAARPCPMCQAVDEGGERFWRLVGTTWQSRWQDALEGGEGLCARHLPGVIARLRAVSSHSAGSVHAIASRRYAMTAWTLERFLDAQAGHGSWPPPHAWHRAVDEASARLFGSVWQAGRAQSKEGGI